MIRQWLRNFMIGRYGFDQLSMALMIVSVIGSIISSFARWGILSLLCTALMILVLFRTYSRNVNARFQENAKFMALWQKIKKWFAFQQKRFNERKTYKYFTCPNCHQMLRVPKGKGKICITCPKCKTELIRKS